MQIGKNKVVSIEYTLRDPKGVVIDTSEGRGPLSYIHGVGNLIPGLESALEGRSVSAEKIAVKVSPEDGYGVREESLVSVIDKSAFQDSPTVEVGMQFHATDESGVRVITITKIEGDQVTIDANHPLAGIALAFDVVIREIREATAEELSHGHVHGPGGHDH